MIAPRESDDRVKALLLLLTPAYGLINNNAKWKVLSHQMLVDLCFLQAPVLPQLFLTINDDLILVMIVKIGDDLLPTVILSITTNIIKSIKGRFSLDTITHGPDVLRYFGLNIN